MMDSFFFVNLLTLVRAQKLHGLLLAKRMLRCCDARRLPFLGASLVDGDGVGRRAATESATLLALAAGELGDVDGLVDVGIVDLWGVADVVVDNLQG